MSKPITIVHTLRHAFVSCPGLRGMEHVRASRSALGLVPARYPVPARLDPALSPEHVRNVGATVEAQLAMRPYSLR